MNSSPALISAATSVALALQLGTAPALTLDLVGRVGQDPSDNALFFDQAAAEIPAYDPDTSRLFVTNSALGVVDVIDLSDPENPLFETTIDPAVDLAGEAVGSPTSVSVANGILAVAVPAEPDTDDGFVAFYATTGTFLSYVQVGALPDAVTFAPNGTLVITSNEGQPNSDNTVDPPGSVSVIDISAGVADATVSTAGFTQFDTMTQDYRELGVRIFGGIYQNISAPGEDAEYVRVSDNVLSVDVEPEYAAVDAASEIAYVTLQENNAIAVVDLQSAGGEAEVTAILPLGLKDHSAAGNGLDPSNRDGFEGKIRNHPVSGMYMPDAIATFLAGGETYLLTANEGDARDYDGYSEEIRGGDLQEAGFEFTSGVGLVRNDKKLGRLLTTLYPPLTAINGIGKKGTMIDKVVAYGARSFTIWNTDGDIVYDSGDDLEQVTLALVPENFNANNDEAGADARSDDKGPEPEGCATAVYKGRTFAFVTLERTGGLIVYDITDPTAPTLTEYVNDRLQPGAPGEGTVEDNLGPESVVFIHGDTRPDGRTLVVLTNEVSGSTLVYEVLP